MTATSGPGYTLMQEAIGFAAVTETPIVIVNVQRGGPSTGQPTLSSQQDIYQARYGSHGDYEIIVLAPSSVQEMFYFTVRAFELSEQFRTPVILLADEVIGHMREKIKVESGSKAVSYTHLIKKVLFLCGHVGNIGAIDQVACEFMRDYGMDCAHIDLSLIHL